MPSPKRRQPPEILPLPASGYCRLRQILAVIPICKSAWYAGIKAGKFPPPVKPSPFGRVAVWRVEAVRALIDEAGERTP